MPLATLTPSEHYWCLVDWLTAQGDTRRTARDTADVIFEWLHGAGLTVTTERKPLP